MTICWIRAFLESTMSYSGVTINFVTLGDSRPKTTCITAERPTCLKNMMDRPLTRWWIDGSKLHGLLRLSWCSKVRAAPIHKNWPLTSVVTPQYVNWLDTSFWRDCKKKMTQRPVHIAILLSFRAAFNGDNDCNPWRTQRKNYSADTSSAMMEPNSLQPSKAQRGCTKSSAQ